MLASGPKVNLSDILFKPQKVKQVLEAMETKSVKNNSKTVRKHEGIVQRGPKKGKLRRGYRYAGEKNNNGYPKIVKVSPKK